MDEAERIVDEALKRAREAKGKKTNEKPAQQGKQGNGQGRKSILIIDAGELPGVADKLRDILSESGILFDRGVPVRVVIPPDGGLPVAATLTTHSVVRMAHQFCRPIKDD